MAAPLPEGWVAALDPASGKTYYAHPVSGKVSWEPPVEEAVPVGGAGAPAAAAAVAAPEAASTASAAPAAAAPAAAAAALPEGWVAAVDPSSGKTYYAHPLSGKTSWEVPVAEAPPAPASSGLVLSEASKAAWRVVLDFARIEGTARVMQKRKRFMGLRKFAELAAKRKQEAAAKKKAEEEEEAAEIRRAALEAARPKRSILQLLDVEVPEPAEKLSIEDFASNSFNLNRKGFFAAKTTVSKVLTWKHEQIKTALLKMPPELVTKALQCNRNIMSFMGERSSRKDAAGHAEKLLKMCQLSPEELRDEVFCQIIKQTTGNPDAASTLQGWQLLGICTGAFSPSKDFEPYLLSHFAAAAAAGEAATAAAAAGGSAADANVVSIGVCARYCMGRVVKTAKLGPRPECATIMEIEACRMRHPVLVRVYHLDGTFDVLPVTSWTTPVQLKQMVCEKRRISSGDGFGVFEMTPESEERFLEPEQRILDLIAYWQRLFEEEKSKGEDNAAKKAKKKALDNSFYRIVFKVHMYFEPLVEDTAAQHEMYVQAVYDLISARYPCGESDCLNLAALQLQAEFGDDGVHELTKKLTRFLPPKWSGEKTSATNAAELTRLHAAHKGMSAASAERAYLAYVKEWQVYGSSFFFVEPQMNVDLPEEVFLAVNPKGVLIINPDSKAVLATYPYSEVPTWGHSGTSFMLNIGNLINSKKLFFVTEQGKEINDLVRNYVNHLLTKAAEAPKEGGAKEGA